MQPIFTAVDDLYTAARNDSELRSVLSSFRFRLRTHFADFDSFCRAWFTELNTYIRNVLQEPGYIMKESCSSFLFFLRLCFAFARPFRLLKSLTRIAPTADREGQRIMDSGKRFFDPKTGKYSGHKDALFDSVSAFFTSCTSFFFLVPSVVSLSLFHLLEIRDTRGC